jgi:hypothetical protein
MKAESCLRLDVRRLKREGVLDRSFCSSWGWTRDGKQTGSIGIRPLGRYSVRLEYACDGSPCDQTVGLHYTECNMGGERVWFGCPVCRQRCAVLFMRSRRFACRQCQRLAYASQSEDEAGRSWRAQQKCERKLGTNWQRPKGMHEKTRQRLLDRISVAEMARESALEAFLTRMCPGLV